MSETIDAPTASTALATIDPTILSVIFATPNGVETTLARIEREAREQAAALDISTEKNRKARKSLAHKVARSKTAMDEAGAGVKAEWLAKSNAIDADRRSIRARLDALKSEILTPVEEYEALIAAKLQANEDAVAAMEGLAIGLSSLTPADINERRAQLKVVAEFDWLPEFVAKAERIRAGVAAQLLVGLQDATQREIEAKAEAERQAAEAERQRLAAIEAQRLREEQIAAEAAAEATRQAEAKAAREAAARERAAQMADYHRGMLQHVKNCGIGFIDSQPQPIGILQHELTSKISYDAENFGDLLPDALAARDAALKALQRSVDESNRRAAKEEADAAAVAKAQRETEAARQSAARAETARVTAHHAAIATLKRLGEPLAHPDPVAVINAKLGQLQEVWGGHDWQEFADDARAAFTSSETALYLAREIEVARVARADAAWQAEQQAAADKRALEAQQKVTAAAEAEAKRREANVAHRKRINGEALEDIVLAIPRNLVAGMAGAPLHEIARAIVIALAKGEVRHCRIEY